MVQDLVTHSQSIFRSVSCGFDFMLLDFFLSLFFLSHLWLYKVDGDSNWPFLIFVFCKGLHCGSWFFTESSEESDGIHYLSSSLLGCLHLLFVIVILISCFGVGPCSCVFCVLCLDLKSVQNYFLSSFSSLFPLSSFVCCTSVSDCTF